MGKIIVILSNNNYKNNNNSTGHLNHTQKLLSMIIVDTPEKDVSNVDRKLDKRKIRTSLIKSSSTLFSCSICAIYNRVHCAKKTSHVEAIYSCDQYINFPQETL